MKTSLNHLKISQIKVHQDRLKYCGITDITSCFKKNVLNMLASECRIVFDEKYKRKDFISFYTKTPRHMSIVGETDVTNASDKIKKFYYSTEMLQLMSEIAGEEVDFLPWTGERYVINGLVCNNDTHGWHWDDYAYALVYIADCPPRGLGGEVECVANTNWVKSNPNIQHLVNTKQVQTYYFEPGSIYFMRSDTTLHRVKEVIAPYKRLSLAMSYCNQRDLSKDIDHLTVLDLYG